MNPVMRTRRLAGPGAERRSWRFKAHLYRHVSTLLMSTSCGLLTLLPIAFAAHWLMPKLHAFNNEWVGTIGFLTGFLAAILAQRSLHGKPNFYRFLIISASLLVTLSTGLLSWSVYKNMTYVPRGPFDGIQYALLAALAACGGGVALMLFVAAVLGGRSRRMLAQLSTQLESPDH